MTAREGVSKFTPESQTPLCIAMAYRSKQAYREYIKLRDAAVDAAKKYLERLPVGLTLYDPEKGGRLEVYYHLPNPGPYIAHYWPHRGEWKYFCPPKRDRPAGWSQQPAHFTDKHRRRARDPEDFIHHFAPGSVAPDSARFQRSLPKRLSEFYTNQGHGAYEAAENRGEVLGRRTQPDAPPEQERASSDPSSEGTGPAETARQTEGEGSGRSGEKQAAAGKDRARARHNRGGGSDIKGSDTPVFSPESESEDPALVSDSHKRSEAAGGRVSPKAFITSRSRVFAEQAQVVGRLLHGLDTTDHAATRRFLCHLLVSGLSSYGAEEFVPISAQLIEREMGIHNTSSVWRPLLDAGLIHRARENKEAGRSRLFSLQAGVRDQFLAAVPRVDGLGATQFVDIVTGRPTRGRKHQQYTTDTTNHSYPPLIKDALSELRRSGCPLDLYAAEAHVDTLGAAYKQAHGEWLEAGSSTDDEPFHAMESARGRWMADVYCLNRIKETEPTREPSGIWRYTPWYTRNFQKSGRITEVGGLQNCSRTMKHVALAGLRLDHDVRNYDLVGSQAWGLVQLFEDFGIETEWLTTYLNADKRVYAERAFGESSTAAVDLWKGCLFALFMGAAMPRSASEVPARVLDIEGLVRRPMEIARVIREAYGAQSIDDANAKLASFRAVVNPFLSARDAWHNQLEMRSANDTSFGVSGRGGRYVRNAAGETLSVDDKSGFVLKSKLAAHLLQGLEAAFIHRLTALAPEYGFLAVNNQHDGLVTVGEIPAAAVERAKAKCHKFDSELRYAKLEEKRYHPDHAVPGLDRAATS